MITNSVDIEKNELLDLHLIVLKELLNGAEFVEIKEKYSDRFQEMNYVEKATGNLLTFHEGKLVGAYPVSPRKTNYKVTIEDIGSGYAMCAIDALGIAFTFMKKTIVESYISDTNESFIFEVDPFANQQSDEDLYVTYKKYNAEMTNVALDVCPTINIYRYKEGVPEDSNLVVIDFETALRYAKERFSQKAINQCFYGQLDTDKIMADVKSSNFSTTCDC